MSGHLVGRAHFDSRLAGPRLGMLRPRFGRLNLRNPLEDSLQASKLLREVVCLTVMPQQPERNSRQWWCMRSRHSHFDDRTEIVEPVLNEPAARSTSPNSCV